MPQEHQGQAVQPTKSAIWSSTPAMAGSGAGLVGGALAAGGRACHLPSGQIPPPWAWWENEAPHHESCSQLVPGNDGDRLTRYGRPMTLTGWAADYAEELLAPLGDRWAHVQGVVRQAERVAAIRVCPRFS